MVLEFATSPTDVIDMEAASPVDEPELTRHWIKQKSEAGNDLFQKFRHQCEELDEFFLNDFDFSVPDGGTMIQRLRFQRSRRRDHDPAGNSPVGD